MCGPADGTGRVPYRAAFLLSDQSEMPVDILNLKDVFRRNGSLPGLFPGVIRSVAHAFGRIGSGWSPCFCRCFEGKSGRRAPAPYLPVIGAVAG